MTSRKETVVGLFVLIGLLCTAYLTVKLGRMELFNTDGYTLYARFASVTGLRPGAEVEIAGVRVGRVTAVTLDKNQPLAVVTMLVNNDVRLTDDVIASVRTSGLIGDKYISLEPGGVGDELHSGDTITDTESAVDIEKLISNYVFGRFKARIVSCDNT